MSLSYVGCYSHPCRILTASTLSLQDSSVGSCRVFSGAWVATRYSIKVQSSKFSKLLEVVAKRTTNWPFQQQTPTTTTKEPFAISLSIRLCSLFRFWQTLHRLAFFPVFIQQRRPDRVPRFIGAYSSSPHTVPLCLGVSGPGIAELRSVACRVASSVVNDPTILSLSFIGRGVPCAVARIGLLG